MRAVVTPMQALAIASCLTVGFAAQAQLLPYNEGDLGDEYLVNEAMTGGADLFVNNGVAFFAAFEVVDIFEVGDEASITGIALPLWANNNNPTNNTLDGTFTFSFYGLGGGANANQHDGLANETLLGEATVVFGEQNTGVMNFGALFDTPIEFTAESTGFAVRVQSTAAFRMKLGPQPASARRININTGARVGNAGAGNQFGNITVLGVVPAPASLAVVPIAMACGFRRRR